MMANLQNTLSKHAPETSTLSKDGLIPFSFPGPMVNALDDTFQLIYTIGIDPAMHISSVFVKA
jgi:hypothetical protein